MKNLFLFSVIVFLLASCGGGADSGKKKSKKKVDKEELFGALNGDVYENSFFNLQVQFDDRWKVKTSSFKSTFGGDLFEASYMGSYYKDYPLNVSLETEKANPFEKPSTIRMAEESIEGFDMLFDESSMVVAPMSKTTIAENEYVVNQIQLLGDADTSFVDEYYTYADGYYLSIICMYSTQLDQNSADNFIKNFKTLK